MDNKIKHHKVNNLNDEYLQLKSFNSKSLQFRYIESTVSMSEGPLLLCEYDVKNAKQCEIELLTGKIVESFVLIDRLLNAKRDRLTYYIRSAKKFYRSLDPCFHTVPYGFCEQKKRTRRRPRKHQQQKQSKSPSPSRSESSNLESPRKSIFTPSESVTSLRSMWDTIERLGSPTDSTVFEEKINTAIDQKFESEMKMVRDQGKRFDDMEDHIKKINETIESLSSKINSPCSSHEEEVKSLESGENKDSPSVNEIQYDDESPLWIEAARKKLSTSDINRCFEIFTQRHGTISISEARREIERMDNRENSFHEQLVQDAMIIALINRDVGIRFFQSNGNTNKRSSLKHSAYEVLNLMSKIISKADRPKR